MASVDLKNLIKIQQVIPAGALAGTEIVYPVVDTAEGHSVTFILSSSGLDSAVDRNIIVEHSDDPVTGFDSNVVPGDRLIPENITPKFSTATPELINFGYVSSKRYVRLTIPAGELSTAGVSGVVVISSLLHNPVTS